MGFLPPDTATWPSPLNGTSAGVTGFKLMVVFMIPVGGHGGDQEPEQAIDEQGGSPADEHPRPGKQTAWHLWAA